MQTKKDYAIDTLVHDILAKERPYDLAKIETAYDFAAKAHEGQVRSSKQPYIIHPVTVAGIILELGMDTDTICAAILHDVIEDTDCTINDIKKRFGQDVALLVDGVTKLNKIPTLTREEQQAENIRKIFLAMNQDPRVIIIKLCDRVHNMRTLKFLKQPKQRRIAFETMNIYVPIANRIGMRTIKEELEDLSFHYLDPFAYSEIEHLLDADKENRENFIENIKSRIDMRFKREDFTAPPYIDGRVKSIYGIYKKLFLGKKCIEEIYDKYAVRIIVSTVAECYSVLGLIHDMFTPIPNRFKDYISTPKENMYQSLHTTVLGRQEIPFEVQIRTWEMHEIAENGIAAHWKYKEGARGTNNKLEQRLEWIRKMLEAHQEADDPEELVNSIKSDIAPEEIAVMTPKGNVISLPVKSTVIDFAYRIHTEIGHKTVGAKVDGKIVPLDYKLNTGEICNIITSKDEEKGPNRSWLEIVVTNEAKTKIRAWFKKECREENIAQGKAILEREFKRHKIDIDSKLLPEFLADDMKKRSCDAIEDFYAAIGYGGISMTKIIDRLKDKYERHYANSDVEMPDITSPVVTVTADVKKHPIILDKLDDCEIAVKFAQCCNPLPGDDIVGFITRGHGLSVHTKACTNYRAALRKNEPKELDRWCEIQWSETNTATLQTNIEVVGTDRMGLLCDIISVIYEARIPIAHSTSRLLKNGNAIIELTITIASTEQLKHLFDKLKRVKDVISAERASI